MITELLLLGVAGIFAVLWYLLRQKDSKQERDISKLYELHHADENKLHDFELEIARNHYPKNELDTRFAQLDATLKEGFKSLGADFKEMAKVLQDHLQQQHKRGG